MRKRRSKINPADIIVPGDVPAIPAVIVPALPEPETDDIDLADWIASQPTREAWLLERLVGDVFPYLTARDFRTPNVRVSCGWTGAGMEGCTLGVCYDASQSAAGVHEIFISPTVDDGARVLAIMFHELAHAIAGVKAGHDAETYGTVCRRLGLTENEGGAPGSWPTCASPGVELRAWIADVIDQCGELYPHAAVIPPPPQVQIVEKPGKPQSTRMLKASCESDGYVVRLTMKWATRGMPACGICGKGMTLEVDQPDAD